MLRESSSTIPSTLRCGTAWERRSTGRSRHPARRRKTAALRPASTRRSRTGRGVRTRSRRTATPATAARLPAARSIGGNAGAGARRPRRGGGRRGGGGGGGRGGGGGEPPPLEELGRILEEKGRDGLERAIHFSLPAEEGAGSLPRLDTHPRTTDRAASALACPPRGCHIPRRPLETSGAAPAATAGGRPTGRRSPDRPLQHPDQILDGERDAPELRVVERRAGDCGGFDEVDDAQVHS